MRQSFRISAVVVLIATSSLAAGAKIDDPSTDPLARLAGRWVGNATMTTVAGPASNFKCVVTYLPRKDGPGIQQNLRCEDDASFKLHAATELTVEGDKVVGRWQDKINDINGTVAGNVTPTGFEVKLLGQFFQATMAVAGEGCDQSVKVMPQKSDVFRELAASLKKC